MTPRDQIQQTLAEFATQLEIPAGAKLDDHDTCVFVFDETLEIILELRNEKDLSLSVSLGIPREEHAAETYRILLEEQFLSDEAGKLFFSINPETGDVYLNEIHSAVELSLPIFEPLLEQFLQSASKWASLISTGALSDEHHATQSQDELPNAIDTLRV